MKKPYVIAVLLLVFISLIAWQHYVKERGKHDSEIFYTSGINGKITYLAANAGAVYCRIANSDRKYMVIPIAVQVK